VPAVRGALGFNGLVPSNLCSELRVSWNWKPAGPWTVTWPPNSTAIFTEGDSGGKMLDSVSKVERYRNEANRCAELAKEASPPFLAEIYRKVAVRYVFMAEELLKGPARDEDAIERADRMISRLRPDAAIEPAGMRRSPGRMPHGQAASGPD
jgi:hypothetical protein